MSGAGKEKLEQKIDHVLYWVCGIWRRDKLVFRNRCIFSFNFLWDGIQIVSVSDYHFMLPK